MADALPAGFHSTGEPDEFNLKNSLRMLFSVTIERPAVTPSSRQLLKPGKPALQESASTFGGASRTLVLLLGMGPSLLLTVPVFK